MELKQILDINLKNFQNREEFINFLQQEYQIDKHCEQKIILYLNSSYVIKIGISNIDYIDNVKYDIRIYNKAKANNLEDFFEPINREGYFKNFYMNGIYSQKRLIVDKTLDLDIVFNNWINKYGRAKVSLLLKFLNDYQILDITSNNIGYDKELNTYKFIDYSPIINPNSIKIFNKWSQSLNLIF